VEEGGAGAHDLRHEEVADRAGVVDEVQPDLGGHITKPGWPGRFLHGRRLGMAPRTANQKSRPRQQHKPHAQRPAKDGAVCLRKEESSPFWQRPHDGVLPDQEWYAVQYTGAQYAGQPKATESAAGNPALPTVYG